MISVDASAKAKKWLTDLLAHATIGDGDVTLMWTPDVVENGLSTGPQIVVSSYPKGSRPRSDFHEVFGYRVYIPKGCLDKIDGHKLDLVSKLGAANGRRL